MSDQVTTHDEVAEVLRRSCAVNAQDKGVEFPQSEQEDIVVDLLPPAQGNESVNQRMAKIATHSGLPDVPELHNPRPKHRGICHEKPEHRMMALLVAQGYSNKEIAERSGYDDTSVYNLKTQVWFQQLVAYEINTAGRQGLIQMLERSSAASVLKLIQLRDESENPNVQLGAAKDLLDRTLGKPTQRVEQEIRTYSSPEEEIRAIDEQLKHLNTPTR